MQRVTPYEAGWWRCKVYEYIPPWNILANPRTVSTSFNITVLNKVPDEKFIVWKSYPIEDCNTAYTIFPLVVE